VAHLRAGAKLPDITLPTTDGTELSLATCTGRSVLAVYPWTGRPGQPNPPRWDDIPGAHGSTPELMGFRDRMPDFARLGINLYGLSRQTSDYQIELVRRLELPFPILSDAAGDLTSALDLPTFTTGGVIYLARATLVILDGVIERVFFPIEDPATHAGEVLTALQSESSSASSTE
jgi:peroxiredoxin